MRAPRKSANEQYRLIMECRSSGLTDNEWCMQHGINTNTFYGWVKRLRMNGYTGIHSASGRNSIATKQEVVRIDGSSHAEDYDSSCNFLNQLPSPLKPAESEPVLEVVIGGDIVRIPNGMSPALVEQTIRLMKELSC